jgi:hypothetical protein
MYKNGKNDTCQNYFRNGGGDNWIKENDRSGKFNYDIS